MAKGKKKAAAAEKDESYLDFLGIEAEAEGEGKEKDPSQADQIAGLMKTIEGLSSTVEGLEQRANMAPAAAPVAPVQLVEPKMSEINLDGLPDQSEDPTAYANALTSRMTSTVNANMKAMGEYTAARNAEATEGTGKTEQLWDDFQSQYMEKLEVDLPKGVEALPYVEVAAKAVAKRAQRRGVDMDTYMFRGAFMQDVFAEADKVLKPLRGESEGEEEGEQHPTAAEAEATRTGGIFGSAGAGEGKGEEIEDKGSLISDLQEIQKKSGFY